MKIRKWLVVFCVFGGLLSSGCGNGFGVHESLDLASVTELKLRCELNAFGSSYYDFLKSKCTSCHIPNGTGAGAFASAIPAVAHEAFRLATTTKIDERALNASHAPGFTGPTNQAALDTAKQNFETAMGACSSTDPDPSSPSSITIERSVAAATQTLRFDLSTDLASGNAVAGASFAITVRSQPAASPNMILYTVSAPTVTTTSTGLRIGEIKMRLNGNELPLVTTYSRLSVDIDAGQTNSSLSGATSQFEAPAPSAGNTNRMSFSFGVLQAL